MAIKTEFEIPKAIFGAIVFPTPLCFGQIPRDVNDIVNRIPNVCFCFSNFLCDIFSDVVKTIFRETSSYQFW